MRGRARREADHYHPGQPRLRLRGQPAQGQPLVSNVITAGNAHTESELGNMARGRLHAGPRPASLWEGQVEAVN